MATQVTAPQSAQEQGYESHRLTMPVGEAMFSQRAIRRLKPDPVPARDLKLILDAASKAPSGGNRQIARFLVVTDRKRIQEFGKLYHEAWWSKRADEKQPFKRREEIPEHDKNHRSAALLADEMKDAPCVVLAFAQAPGPAHSVLPACQNLMLAARALGIGSVITTLHPKVMERFNAMFGVPKDMVFHHCIPLGYPRGNFGPTNRLPTSQTTFFDAWGQPPPWK